MSADPITGYSDFRQQENGRVWALAHRESGAMERVEVRVSVESQITRAGGKVEPAREVASTDDGSVRIAEGASL